MLKVIQLVHFGIFPVFVVDGISPKMKAETIRKRREQRQRAAGGDEHVDDVMAGDGGHLVGGGSGMFAWILEEWKVLLAQLGLPVVQSVGEAEATCAQLNARGVSHHTGEWGLLFPTVKPASSISRTKFQNSNVSCILLQLSSPNPLKPGVKLRMKM